MSSHLARNIPIHTIESGPAGGVIGSANLTSNVFSTRNLLAIDMGGTTFKVSVIEEGRPRLKNEGEVEWGVPYRIPMIDLSEIGAGGGSIAWIDRGGVLRVGPQSAGADQAGGAPHRDSRPFEGSLMAAKTEAKLRVVADNRKARFNYFIDETMEAGVALTGTEVKSLRAGKATIAEAYADSRDGEIWLINSNIPEYQQAHRFNHAPKRPRKLLLHRRQINKLIGAVEREGMTIVPLKFYFNDRGRAKIEIALARGKKLYDKRDTERKRSWERERGRLLRQKG